MRIYIISSVHFCCCYISEAESDEAKTCFQVVGMLEQQVDGEACVRSISHREIQVYDWADDKRRLG